VPALAAHLPASIGQINSTRYRNPRTLPAGGVLVVGASASGVQLADELASAGRDVVIAVGSHTRMPRRYRGWDIFRGFERAGLLDTTVDELPDGAAGSRAPSLQLVGRPSAAPIDLNTLQARDVHVVGRLRHIDGQRMHFEDDLPATVAAAERRMHRSLDRIDHSIARAGLDADVDAPERPRAIALPSATTEIDLADRGITTVLWATGFGRSYPWLHVPVTDAAGEIRQHRGMSPAPGLYVLGLRFQHHRNSNFIDGVGRDATHIAKCIVADRAHREGVAA
jgi:putative flavoprotein involved in K+ transport